MVRGGIAARGSEHEFTSIDTSVCSQDRFDKDWLCQRGNDPNLTNDMNNYLVPFIRKLPDSDALCRFVRQFKFQPCAYACPQPACLYQIWSIEHCE
jgi:hypothetical protein